MGHETTAFLLLRLQQLPSLGWTVGHQHISLWHYTVRHGMRILARADQAVRQDRYNRWLAEIDLTSPSIPLHRVLTRLWQTNIHDRWKLPFLEGLQDAQLNAERMRLATPCGCATSGLSPGRYHHFVECPPTRAVYEMLGALLNHPDIVRHINTDQPPDDYPSHLWSLICVLAVYAIDCGQCHIYRRTTPEDRPPNASVGWTARKVATDTLWHLLDYYSTSLPPGQPWHADLPILCWDMDQNRWHTAPALLPPSDNSSL